MQIRRLIACSCAWMMFAGCQAARPDAELTEGTGKTSKAYGRFASWLDSIRTTLSQYQDVNKAAAELHKSDVRSHAFHLQALAKLYQSEKKQFREMRSAFKQLEDGIGGVDMWSDVLKYGQKNNAPKEKMQQIADKLQGATWELASTLRDGGWLDMGEGTVPYYQQWLQEYDFGSYRQDRTRLLTEFQNQLRELEKTQYDVGILEEGNGLHELRRSVRWFVIGARSTNGLIQHRTDANDCPAPALAKLVTMPVARSKYAALPDGAGEREPCRISQCLFLSLVDMVAVLGDIKDEAERRNNTAAEYSDEVPEDLRGQAQSVYDAFRQTQAGKSLRAQLKECR